eukprot:TRINITY_DN14733_c0_g1_i2.p1 TRINITY_DN14733_c0_g1~~TRINITY_DN14733_c0_g1_i2.p1  ORF type:complete len:480 (-),score=142.85 TRINITY_DN14733_c0_g1_i2:32-1402(-)
MSIPIALKWGKNKYDVLVNPQDNAAVFKSQVWTLTGVPPDRQKYPGIKSAKGGKLDDSVNMGSLNFAPNANIMLMGTAGPLPTEPVKVTFLEDLAPSQTEVISPYTPGLTNLGNTCYLNSALQILRTSPSLSLLRPPSRNSPITGPLSSLLTDLSRPSSNPITPLGMVASWRNTFPQFAEKQSDHFLQQDAEEAWTTLTREVSKDFPKVLDAFRGTIKQTITNNEEPTEVNVGHEEMLKLTCHCDKQTEFLTDGLKKEMKGELEKHSSQLGRTCVWSIDKQIEQLPWLLCVQFVRFEWRKDNNKKTKITKSIDFPTVLDLMDLCTPELKAKIKPVQDKYRVSQEKKRDEEKKRKKGEEEGRMEEDVKGEEEDGDLKVDEGRNKSGMYELYGILSHKGRSADGGHYVSWVKREDGKGWLCYDDEDVIECSEDKIRDLTGRGGADWHIAYLLFYKSVL